MIIQIACIVLSAVLFAWGGYSQKWLRRFVLPLILTAAMFYLSHSWYSLFSLLSVVALSMGYGDNSIFRHVFGNGWGRGVWGLLVGLCLSLGLFLSGHIYWYFLVPYLILSFTLENALKNINQIIGDLIIGAAFAVIVFMIHI